MNALTAAHKTLPLPSMVEVTNPANGRRVLLRVNDRGPFVDNRIIDLSRGAADALGLLNQGVGEVRVRYVGRAPRTGGGMRLADAGSRESRQPAEAAPAPAPATQSSTARPYNEVVRGAPRQQPARQTPSRADRGTPTAYPRTRRDVPIPDQPLPPVMPPRDASLVVAPVVAAPFPVPVVPPTPPPPVQVPAPVASVVVTYRVQVISFDERAFADGVARRLGGGATVETYERNGRMLYRVVTGPWGSQAAAETARQAVIARGFADALLIAD